MGQSKQQTTTTSNNTTAPWSVQQPFLQEAFGGAQGALQSANNNAGSSQYGAPGAFTAQYTPEMMNAFQQELGYGTGQGGISQNTQQNSNYLLNNGASGAANGINGFQNFSPTGGTQYNIDAANRYVQGADVPGMVAASMRDANQNYNDITAPAIQRGAAVSGNINSTAPAIQQGIIQRGLAQRAGDISSTLRSNLYQQGLNLANTQAGQDTQARLAALQGETSGGLGAANSGIYGNSSAINQQAGLFNIANTGAQNTLAGNQADLTNQLQAYQFGQNSPFTALNNFYNLVGNRSWGSTGSGTSVANSSSTPSPMSMISGGIGMLGSLF